MEDTSSSISAGSSAFDRFTIRFNNLFIAMFSYSTVREARVHNFKVTLIFRVIQVSILAYVIGLVQAGRIFPLMNLKFLKFFDFV